MDFWENGSLRGCNLWKEYDRVEWMKNETEKRFQDWIKVKEGLHEGDALRTIKEGEIWWCGVGENVGVEINGKGMICENCYCNIKIPPAS